MDKIQIKHISFIIFPILAFIIAIIGIFDAYRFANTNGLAFVAYLYYFVFILFRLFVALIVSFFIELIYNCCKPDVIYLKKSLAGCLIFASVSPFILYFFYPYAAKLGENAKRAKFTRIENSRIEVLPKPQNTYYTEAIPNRKVKNITINPCMHNSVQLSSEELNQIKNKWNLPELTDYKTTFVKIKISGNGDVLSQTIYKSSGDMNFDNSVKKAIISSVSIFKGKSEASIGLCFHAGPNMKEVSIYNY